MPKLTPNRRWIWIVMADGKLLRTFIWRDESGFYNGQYGEGFATHKAADAAKRKKVRECLAMMERVKHDEQCQARWQATALSVQVVRIKLPEGENK